MNLKNGKKVDKKGINIHFKKGSTEKNKKSIPSVCTERANIVIGNFFCKTLTQGHNFVRRNVKKDKNAKEYGKKAVGFKLFLL